MQFSFSDIWQHMGGPAIAVASVLLLMGMASLTVFVERIFSLRRSRRASRVFSSRVAEAVSTVVMTDPAPDLSVTSFTAPGSALAGRNLRPERRLGPDATDSG